MYLIVGLGNPGEKYQNTRHNLGFEALEHFRHKDGFSPWNTEEKFKAEIIKYGDIILARPLTFMNKSGLAVKKIADYYKVPYQSIVVIHDDLDIVLGHIKIRQGGSAAGHHGVESIIDELGDDKFVRFRLGIGNQRAISGEHKQISFNAEKYVLEQFGPGENSKIKALIKKCLKALDLYLQEGLEKAQSQFNDRGL